MTNESEPTARYGTKRSLCDRKQRYKTWADAEREALRVMDEDGGDAQVYGCTYCNGWHFGHPPRIAYSPLSQPDRGRRSHEAWNR